MHFNNYFDYCEVKWDKSDENPYYGPYTKWPIFVVVKIFVIWRSSNFCSRFLDCSNSGSYRVLFLKNCNTLSTVLVVAVAQLNTSRLFQMVVYFIEFIHWAQLAVLSQEGRHLYFICITEKNNIYNFRCIKISVEL